jgi:hypothetical protein
MVRIVVSLIAIMLLAMPAAGQKPFEAEQLRKVKAVFVFVGSTFQDDCLPQPGALKVEAELILRRSGISVVEEPNPSAHILPIITSGFAIPGTAIPGGCAADISVVLERHETLSDGSSAFVRATPNLGTLYFGPMNTFQRGLREWVNGQVSLIASEILKARQSEDPLGIRPK